MTPCSRVLPEKLTSFQLVKKLPSFYGTRKFITTFASARRLSLSWGSSNQSTPPQPTSWGAILILSSHLCLGLPSEKWKNTYLLTYLLTYSMQLPEKLTSFQLVEKLPSFYGTRKFITTFASARHLSLSWASSIQSIPPQPTSWASILILFSHLRLGLPSEKGKNTYWNSHVIHNWKHPHGLKEFPYKISYHKWKLLIFK